ncbi:hypothetical protein GCM10010343_39080 [Streptomyces avidinii]|nr:hypothetical protein GCM10010343_39080 [Streptomyces avidinii]
MAGRAGDQRAHARQARARGTSDATTTDLRGAAMAVPYLRGGVRIHWSAGFHAEPPLPTRGQVRSHATGQAQGKGRRRSG